MSRDVLTYRPHPGYSPRVRRWVLGFTLVFMCVSLVRGVSTGSWSGLGPAMLMLFGFVFSQWMATRTEFRADETGIHARLVMNEPWESIESIKRPTQWDDGVMVRMVGSGEERRTGFPAEHAEKLAAIGRKPIR